MENTQIAHDLAVAKSANSELSTKELISEYRKYYDEFLKELNSEPVEIGTIKAMPNPFG